MDLIDALGSMPEANTVVEYSLSPLFRRSYSTIFKAIDESKLKEKLLAEQYSALFATSSAVAVLAIDGGCDTESSPLCEYIRGSRNGLPTGSSERQATGYDRT